MIFQSRSPELFQIAEDHQLGAPLDVYKRYVTLSGKTAFTGILLLGLGIIGLGTQLFTPASPDSFPANLLPMLPEWGQFIFLIGILLAGIRYEELSSPAPDHFHGLSFP